MRPNSISLSAAFALAAALATLAGCSVGTGVTPTCNPDATDATSCDPPPTCDDGKGGVLPTGDCCLLRANDEYNLTCMAENAAGKDYRTLCGLNGPGLAACCNAAKSALDNCIKGK